MAHTLLVTGGAGFIGSNFVRYILANTDCHVINLDALTYAGNPENLGECYEHPRHTFIHGSIGNRELVRYLCRRYKVHGIINFAAETHVDRSITGAEAFLSTNVLGTLSLLDVAKESDIERYVQISTDEVYGSLGDEGAFTEDSSLAPNSPYAASKASADLIVRSYIHTHGLPAVITRCSNNYGPCQFPEKLIPLIILNALEDCPLPVYGQGLNVRDWLYVEDHCAAIWSVYERGKEGEVYNIGGNCEMKNIDVVKAVLQVLGKPDSLISYVKDRPGHDWRYAIDASKIRNELGWMPSLTFEEGLEKTIRWYSDHPDWCRNVRSGAYKDYYSKQYVVN